MLLPQRIRVSATPLTLWVLAMGLTVALWGAGYKMAQYPQQGHAFRVMAPAKLLTEKERPARLDALRAGLTSGEEKRLPRRHLSGWFKSLCCSTQLAHFSKPFVLAVRRSTTASPELTYFSFRPPPSQFIS